MKLFLILLAFGISIVSCSNKMLAVKPGKFRYYEKQFLDYVEVNVDLFADDSIRVGTYKGHNYKTCVGVINSIGKNRYKLMCYDTVRNTNDKFMDLIPRFDLLSDTIIYHNSYIELWGLKIKRVSTDGNDN